MTRIPVLWVSTLGIATLILQTARLCVNHPPDTGNSLHKYSQEEPLAVSFILQKLPEVI